MSIFNFWKDKSKEVKIPVLILNEPQTLSAKLLFDTSPILDENQLKEAIAKEFSLFDYNITEKGKAWQYFLRDYEVQFKEGAMPAQCVMFKPSENNSIAKDLEKAYRQLWHWDEAVEKTKNCKHELIITDLFTLNLEYKQRVALFQKFLSAVSRLLQPVAIYFPTSEKIVETSAYLNLFKSDGRLSLYALMNVRLFNVTGGGILMDTLGLHALGLPDFQMKFESHDVQKIAGLLHSYGEYIFEYGSVIEHGNTVEGIETGSRWKCLYDKAAVEPVRNVIRISDK